MSFNNYVYLGPLLIVDKLKIQSSVYSDDVFFSSETNDDVWMCNQTCYNLFKDEQNYGIDVNAEIINQVMNRFHNDDKIKDVMNKLKQDFGENCFTVKFRLYEYVL